MPQKLLILGCTHGDEQVGKYIFNKFAYGESKYFSYKSAISNPEAMMLNVRFVDQDLNRSFPGDPNGNYEQRRTFQLMKEFQKYDYVIDLHQTFAHMEDTIFIGKKTEKNLEFIKYIDITKVVLEEDGYENGKTSVEDNVECGFGLEFARLGRYDEDCKRVESVIENIIHQHQKHEYKEFFNMYTKIPKGRETVGMTDWIKLTEMQLQALNLPLDKELYPIFINEPAYTEYYCVIVEKTF